MDAPGLDDLAPEEVRVLACLIEKEATVPDSYPLTLNSLRTACNQSTSRDPVVSYEDRDVEVALGHLRERGLTRIVHSTSNRATKYRHVVPEALGLDAAETAVLAVLMLRGPQTVGELKSRTERQHGFDSTDEVDEVLGRLAAAGHAHQRARQPGEKEARWVFPSSDRVDEAAEPAGSGAEHAGDEPDASDPYAATAEYYDLLATGHWDTFGLQLLDLLDGVDPANGPIVDLGAGTGVGLPYVTAAVPGARIHAVEPSRSMRIALHARLTDDADLRDAVTVDPRRFDPDALPERASALVASAVVGHLTDDERRRLWAYVARALPAGAPAVIEVLPPERPVAVPPTMYREVRVGTYVYEGWQRGEPVDAQTMAWTMTYRVRRDGALVAETEVTARWRCMSIDDVRTEVGAHGLDLTEHDDVVVLRRHAPNAVQSA